MKLYPIQGLFEFLREFLPVYGGFAYTTAYRAQMTYEINPLFVEYFGGVTVQRAEATSCNFRAPIATLGALGNLREVLTHPNCTQIFARPVNTSVLDHHKSGWRLLVKPRQRARGTIDELLKFSSDLDLDSAAADVVSVFRHPRPRRSFPSGSQRRRRQPAFPGKDGG